MCGIAEKRWANYLALRLKAVEVEQRIAEEYISPEQMDVLRGEVIGIDWSFTIAATAKLFIPPIFENKKKANGYWF